MSTPISAGNSFHPAQLPNTNGAAEAMATQGNAAVPREANAQQVLQSKTFLQTGTAGSPAATLDDPSPTADVGAAQASLAAFNDAQVSADIYAFMALFQKMAQEMRNTARTQRTTEFQGQITALQNAADKMKDAAGQRLTAAIVQGAFQIASGAMQAGMSAASAISTVKGAKMEAQGKNDLATINEFKGDRNAFSAQVETHLTHNANNLVRDGQIAGAQGARMQGYSQGASGMAAGLGGMIAAGFNYKADLLDADKANLETQAKLHETAVQHANDMMQQMMDVIRDVRDKLASIQQSQVETTRGIARNI